MNYDWIKNKIEVTTCKEHARHPEVTIDGDNVQIRACCENFRTECFGLLKDLIIQDTHNSIMNAFNGIK